MKPETKKRIKKWLGWLGSAVVILLLITFLEGQWQWLGLIGFVLIFGGIAIYRMFRGGFFMVGLRNMETAIWGKPLDKDNWQKGELKNTKLEATYKGKPFSWKNFIPSPKKFTNKHAAATFFVFFIVFFFIFVMNKYTMNIIMAIIMLQLSLYFKTAQMIRELQDDINNKGEING